MTLLSSTFEKCAERIWDELTYARSVGLIRDEETISNNLLLEVQKAHPQDVLTFQFRKKEEKFTGADWEWWLTDNHSWFGLLIQAKRLGSKSHKYEGLKHLVGKNRIPQIDILLSCARKKGIDPLYFFYNYDSGRIASLPWNCKKIGPDFKQLGCTTAHAVAINRLLAQGGAGLPKTSAISYPLRCLVSCPCFASPNSSLPQGAYAVARILRGAAEEESISEALPDQPSPRRDPPSYVRRLSEVRPEERGRVIDELREEVGQIGSLMIIKSERRS